MNTGGPCSTWPSMHSPLPLPLVVSVGRPGVSLLLCSFLYVVHFAHGGPTCTRALRLRPLTPLVFMVGSRAPYDFVS